MPLFVLFCQNTKKNKKNVENSEKKYKNEGIQKKMLENDKRTIKRENCPRNERGKGSERIMEKKEKISFLNHYLYQVFS